MMLAASAFSNVTAALSAAIFSPSSRATGKKTVAPMRFRYEPYSARVFAALPAESPSKFAYAAVSTSITAPSPVEPVYPMVAAASTPAAVVAAVAPVAKAAVAQISGAVRFAVIRFKHESATFIAPFKVSSGDLVVVEGDRGENIGVVANIMKDAPSYQVSSRIVRRASDKDREMLAAQREREATAVRATRAMAEAFGLAGKVEDAEYQFDMNKLTIFVRRPSKSTFVDFRKLQRGLFREFRCRIWCSYMDEVEAAEAAPRFK